MKPLSISSDHELHRALRQRVEELQVTYESIDEVAGFTARYASKLLAPTQIKRFAGMSRWALVGALGCKLVLMVDREKTRRLLPKLSKRRVKMASRAVKWGGGATRSAYRLVSRAYVRKCGQNGGKARLVTMTAKQRSRQAQQAARARWGHVKATPPHGGVTGAQR